MMGIYDMAQYTINSQLDSVVDKLMILVDGLIQNI